jgi:AGZA family xanthine/uracil permease-like MFS transporter
MSRSGLMPRWGDINGLCGLLVDNAAALVLLYTLLAAPGVRLDRFAPSFVLTWMIPGCVTGVLVGALLYAFMAWRLARRTGQENVTAMPVGLDTPSVFAISLFVLLPALAEGRELFKSQEHDSLKLHHLASVYAWHVGAVVVIMLGLIKVVLAPLGHIVRRLCPRAALLGSLAAVALALIAFIPLARHIAPAPVVGVPVLIIIFATLFGQRSAHDRIPGALLAIGVGFAIVLTSVWLGRGWQFVPLPDTSLLRPGPVDPLEAQVWEPDWWKEVVNSAVQKLPLALPFALFTLVGGVQCAESASAAGDSYGTGRVLLVQGLATSLAGLLGGVVQITPYFGHPAYKKMGAGWAYVILGAAALALTGYFGWFARLFEWVPGAVFFPLIVYIGLRTISHSFEATPQRDYPAMALAAVPVLAYLIVITADELFAGQKPGPHGVVLLQSLRCLGNGFIVTSLLWATALTAILDGRPRLAVFPLLIAACCSLVGLMHSPFPGAPLAWPQDVWEQLTKSRNASVQFQSPFHWAGAYLLAAVVMLVNSFFQAKPSGPYVAESISNNAAMSELQ